jgi:protein-S-isoprenylcysteine O-methyltransferase Ste14
MLESPRYQTLGLLLSLAGCAWLAWTDQFLLGHFSGDLNNRKIIMSGPYHSVRHPRYLALLSSRVAFALALASILAWVFCIFWLLAIRRRLV